MITRGTMAHDRLLETLKPNIRTVSTDQRGERARREAVERRAKAIARRENSGKTPSPA